ncbi:VOC family protein [Alteromonadaceae bacterium BrNp21-10]|nr:VOC family protein [Alteromonadaceae bacterium BrNp21-10]
MIGYITVGTNNFSQAASFYDSLLSKLGASRTMEADDFIAWGKSSDTPMFSIHKPADGKVATVGNGVMIALQADNSEQVAAVYQHAITLGAKDEGQPGPRGDSGFYAAYFRDLDGNKLNAHCMG